MMASVEKIAEAKAKYGGTVQEILANEPRFGIYKTLGAIEALISSKILQKLPTTPAERMLFAFAWFSREVQNGGLHQFFVNSAGDYWKDVLMGLELVSDTDGLALFRKVLAVFPQSSPCEERDARLAQIENLEAGNEADFWKHFERMDKAFDKRPFPEWQKVFDYVKIHQNEFDLRKA